MLSRFARRAHALPLRSAALRTFSSAAPTPAASQQKSAKTYYSTSPSRFILSIVICIVNRTLMYPFNIFICLYLFPLFTGSLPKEALPTQWLTRMALWDSFVAANPPHASAASPAPVRVSLAFNGAPLCEVSAEPGVTTAQSLLASLPASAAAKSPDVASAVASALVAVVAGEPWDLSRPLPVSLAPGAVVDLQDFTTPTGSSTLWHSAAHVLGQALEFQYRDALVHLSDGPALADGGFFYDALLHDKTTGAARTISLDDLPAVTKVCRQAVTFDQPFERIDVPIAFARKVFAGNPFKQQILDRIAAAGVSSPCATNANADSASASASASSASEEPTVSLYRCGPLVDLCRGPHVPSTGRIPKTAIIAHKTSSSLLHAPLPVPAGADVAAALAAAAASAASPAGDVAATALAASVAGAGAAAGAGGALQSPPHESRTVQRVYGMAFPSDSLFADWQTAVKNAEKADHRRLGRELSLFMFHPVSPGSAFFLPHGTRVYNALVEFMRRHYRRRGFSEVRTPQVFDKSLWQQSGHWDKYQDDMFYVSAGHSSDPSSAAATPSKPAPATASATVKTANAVSTEAEPQAPLRDEELQCTGALAAAPGAAHGLFAAGTQPAATEEHSCSHGHNSPSHSRTAAAVPVSGNGSLDNATSTQALKPMNCPGHCVLFGASAHSYRDLPLRVADFGGLHRNEVSGALSGLTRVRAFSQDDAHIFCTPEQLRGELADCVQFIRDVYGAFGFPFHFRLSTRPEKYIGELAGWDAAEQTLAECLDAAVGAGKWGLNPGDGAFYGPKVDVTVRDALGRLHQCATIQLDFNLPRRFGLKYRAADGTEQTPVMIHRAILGSVERFLAVVLEHTLGRLPLWLSPRHVAVCAVAPCYADYAGSVAKTLRDKGFYADAADAGLTLAKQVRMSQALQYNYILVVGEAEAQTGAVSVRARGVIGEEPKPEPLANFIARIEEEKESGQGFKQQ